MAARVRVFGATQIEGQAPLGRRDRVVLAALVVSWSSAMSAAGLAEALYGEDPPQTWRKVVQGSVARLRQLLGPRTIETTPDGYRLTIGDDDVDVRLFERLLRQAVELSEVGQPAGAVAPLRDALGLFRGEPLADLDGWMPGREEAGRLAELGRLGEERLVAVLLADGRVDEAATAAQSLAERQPLREQRWALLAEALYRCDRQADALRAIDRARRLLREELGVDPGPALVAIERAVLEHDQSLAAGAERRRVSAACPYKGLAAYGIEDAESFFGRDADISSGVNRLSQTGVLAIVGPSGSGKSSLARAGVAPALRRSGRVVVVFTPGTDPVGQLRSVPPSAAIVVDQLEELFTLTVDAGQRLAFSELLAARAVTAPVVLTLRADFVAAVGGVPPLAELVQSGMQLLGPMNETQLRAAITEPAIRAGLRLEPGLVDLLIRDVEGQSGALPLLSHALAETWARREDWVLTVAGYRAGGGVQGAVAATADRVVDHLPPEGRRISRSMFLRLVSLSDAGAPVSHRLARSDLARDDHHAQVLDALLASRLVMANADSVEVTHEALGRAWPRLRTWLDEDREGQRIFRHLATTAAEWERTGRDESDLYRGGRLRTAEEWVVAAKPDLTKVEHEFLDASTARRRSEEADLAAQAVVTRRTNRRLHRALVGVGALLVLAIVAGVTAFAAQRRASSEERAASHRALVSNSVALRTNKRDLAALLAIEAHRLGPDASTESALFGTFTSALGLERSVKAQAQIEGGIRNATVLLDSDTMLLPGHGTVHAVDIETGTETYRLELVPDVEGGFMWVSPTPDSRYVATAWRRSDTNPGRGVVNVWDLASRQKRFDDIEVPFSMGAVAISPDASYVAIGGGRDARILIYDGATGAFLREIRPIAPPPDAHFYINTVALTFTPAGELIVGSQVGPVRFIDPGSGEEVRRIKGFPETAEGEIRLSSDGLTLLTVGWQGLMRYETMSGRPLWEKPTAFRCGPLALLERDGLVLCGDDFTGVATEIDLATGVVLGPRPGRQAGAVCGLLDSPEESTLVETTCGSTDYVLWRLDGGGAASRLVAPVTGEHFAGHYLADGRVVVELPGEGEERVTNLIDVGSGDRKPLPGIWGPMSTDEPGIVLAAFDDSTGGLYDLATGQRVGPSIDLGPSFSSPLLTRQQALIMGGSFDGDVVSGYLRAVDRSGATVFERQEPRVVFRAAAPDDDHLVTLDCTSGGCNLQPRDPQTGAPLREALGEPGDGPSALAAAGGTLVAVWANGDVRVLDPDTLGSVGGPLPGLSGGAAEVKLSDDGRRLLILLPEGSLRLYDVPSRTQLGDPIPLGIGEAGAAFRPDGLEAAVGTDHGIVVWDLDPQHWAERACAIAGRNLTQAEWYQYVGDLAPYRSTCPQFSAGA